LTLWPTIQPYIHFHIGCRHVYVLARNKENPTYLYLWQKVIAEFRLMQREEGT